MEKDIRIRRDSNASSLFAFSPEQLAVLQDPRNNIAAFMQYGGVEGLVKGLRSNGTKGLGTFSSDYAISGSTRVDTNSSRSSPTSRLSDKVTRFESVTKKTKSTVREDELDSDALLAQRRAVFLDNKLPTKKQPKFIHLVWMAYNDPVLFLLTAAAAVSLAIGLYQTFTITHTSTNPGVEWVEGVAILVAVVIIVLVGSVNDWQKQQQFLKLNEKQLERDAKVIRFGGSRVIAGSDVLVGDIVHLEPGDVVPADGILVNGYKVMCDESSATGESELVHKTPGGEAFALMQARQGDPDQESLPPLDPFILSGTKVMEGVGTFLVTATGINSSYGKILASLRDDEDPTPLQARLAILAKYISWLGGVIALLLFVALFIRFLAELPHDSQPPAEKGKNFVNLVIISLTVLVIAVPEGLPLAVTLSLAFATKRMLKDKNLVRQLQACETMGNATNICSDKTGTLTQNKMTVVTGTVGPDFRFHDGLGMSISDISSTGELVASDRLSPKEFVRDLSREVRTIIRDSISLNSTAFESKDGSSFVGSNTESALLNFAKDFLDMGPVERERSEAGIAQLIPFNALRQCMATVIELPHSPGTYRVFVKGASEVLLSKTTRIIKDPTSSLDDIEMSPETTQLVSKTISTYASKGLRTIGLFYRDLPAQSMDEEAGPELDTSVVDFTLEYLLEDLVFVGVMGIQDPLRPGVPESVLTCQKAGVTVRMVTGDNIFTAKAIAKQCGILSDDESDIAMEGAEFRALSEAEMEEKVPHLKVIARSSPADKQKLVVHLKKMGEIVAVTGDGTNDASAMSAADVSFAMGGVTGTEVAREASSIILMTDDFTCIVKAIMWGRAVNDSVKKFLQFQITITVSSVLLAFVSAVSNSSEQSVLTPVQLMWINLFQDTLAALALATDAPQRRVLDRKPEPRLAPLINTPMWKTIVGQSIYQLAVTLILYFAGPKIFRYTTSHEIIQVETLVFNAYVWMQICNMYNCRQYDNTLNVFEGMFNNWLFMGVSTLMIAMQIMIIFVGGQAFSVVPLTGVQWAVSLILGLLTLVIGVLIRKIPDSLFERFIDIFKPIWNSLRFRRRRNTDDVERNEV